MYDFTDELEVLESKIRHQETELVNLDEIRDELRETLSEIERKMQSSRTKLGHLTYRKQCIQVLSKPLK